MFAAIFVAVKSISKEIESSDGITVNDLFRNRVFSSLIVSVMATYGLWLVASLIMFDPWHMFTSLVQYMLLTPTFTNILNVYAFCNTHDITWGTKGDDKAEKLPSVSTKDGQGKTEVPDEGDLDAQYERELHTFSTKEVKVNKPPTDAQLQEAQMDYYRWIRSCIVLVWMITNFALAAVVLSTAGVQKLTPDSTVSDPADLEKEKADRASLYLSIVLWSVAGLSAFKFLGALWFLIVRMFRGV